MPLRRPRRRTVVVALAAVASSSALAGCGAAGIRETDDDGGDRVRVVATTPVLADLVRQVGGDRVLAESLVPPGGDPHSYEPTPADADRVSRADATFTNHLLLEEHALIKAIDANAPHEAPNVSLAEASETYGARVLPLVEDVGVDVLWLGLRVRGDGRRLGATRASDVLLTATGLEGPGDLAAYRTHALGRPEILLSSRDGFSAAADTAVLPPAAHTHLNWAFTRAGTYRLTLEARLRTDGRTGGRLARGTFEFVVGDAGRAAAGRTSGGRDAAPARATASGAASGPARAADGGSSSRLAGPRDRTVLDEGHTDLTVDLDERRLYAYSGGDGREQRVVAPEDALLAVPDRAATTIPRDGRFSFLGRPGGRVLQLPQAVLGKHVHGEIDPHLWQDVGNAKAYALLIRDTLAEADPAHADAYRRRAAAYARRLDALDREVRDTVAAIPRARRQLVTTHDAFAYLADAYGLTVAGFVVPNPAQEPSARQVRELHATIDDLDVPAVFLEPNLQERAGVLRQVAADRGVSVCRLYGDAFDDEVRDYEAMMRHNARELRRCLGGTA